MKIDALIPDAAPALVQPNAGEPLFARLVDAAGGQLDRADRAEAALTQGRGGITEMMVERARADIALQIAATAASRGAQALNTVLGMQI